MRKLTYLLIFVSFVSAIGVIWVRHANREAMVDLYAQYERRDELNVEWRRLLLERTSLSSFEQLESWIRTNHDISESEDNRIILLANNPLESGQAAAVKVQQ